MVVRNEDLDAAYVTEPLALAVEVLSPSTRRKDLVLKRSRYEAAGVASYRVLDPEAPSVLALDLVDGHYRTAGQASGDEKPELSCRSRSP